jgi:hypothetical protein
MLAVMDDAEQLRRLPLGYAVALRLSEAGADDATIAVALGIELDCVGATLEIARAKAERIGRASAEPQLLPGADAELPHRAIEVRLDGPDG